MPLEDPVEDIDTDDEGDLDVEHFPLPAALLAAAGITTDEEWDALPSGAA